MGRIEKLATKSYRRLVPCLSRTGGGTVMATLFIPATMNYTIAALFGFIGGVIGLLLMVGIVYVINIILVFKKQRDEVDSKLDNTLEEKNTIKTELINVHTEVTKLKEERDALIQQSSILKFASHTYIPESYIHGRIIYILDLIAPGARPVIQKRTIEDCEIRGPAMIGFLGTCNLDNLTFDGDRNSIFVEVGLNKPLLGVIGLEDCNVRRCRLVAIGIIGVRQQIAQMEKAFNPP